jgi:hypothetical protein
MLIPIVVRAAAAVHPGIHDSIIRSGPAAAAGRAPGGGPDGPGPGPGRAARGTPGTPGSRWPHPVVAAARAGLGASRGRGYATGDSDRDLSAPGPAAAGTRLCRGAAWSRPGGLMAVLGGMGHHDSVTVGTRTQCRPRLSHCGMVPVIHTQAASPSQAASVAPT